VISPDGYALSLAQVLPPGVYIAMTYVLLPFMVLPLYGVMKGISPIHMRAAPRSRADGYAVRSIVRHPMSSARRMQVLPASLMRLCSAPYGPVSGNGQYSDRSVARLQSFLFLR
jgi:hypothetical protein